ncbi:MAG: hypothetical protein ACM3NH_05050 [Candidatus Saccharibacteria bacterium]
MNLGLRQQKILAAIVKEYSETAKPVGSQELAEKYNFKESPATIRNEMGTLEKLGLIYQPHKSAGRIPTDEGFRFFVNQLMRRFELSEKERRLMRGELMKLQGQHEQLSRQISNLIAQVSGQAAFALLPNETSATGLSHIIQDPEVHDPETISAIAEVFDHLDEHAQKLGKSLEVAPEAFIGKELPLPVPKNLSLVISNVTLKSGKQGIIGIVGPKRMSYAKNLSLLEYLAKLLSGSAAFIVFVNFMINK